MAKYDIIWKDPATNKAKIQYEDGSTLDTSLDAAEKQLNEQVVASNTSVVSPVPNFGSMNGLPMVPTVASVIDRGAGTPTTPTTDAPLPTQVVSSAGIPATTPTGGSTQAPSMAAPMPGTIKTGEQVTTIPGFKPSKTVTGLMETSAKKQAEAIRLSTEAGQEKAKAEETHFQDLVDQQNLANTIAASAEEGRQLEQDILSNNVKTSIQEAADAKVDPGKFFKEKGTLASIGAAFAIGLGAYAASITGGKNNAMDIIDNAIDRDIAAQKQAIQSKQQKVQDLKGSLQDMRVRFQDERQAEAAARAQQYEVAINSLKGRLAGIGNKEALASGQKLLADMEAKKAENLMNLEQLAQGKKQTTSNFETSIGGMTPAGAASLQKKNDEIREYQAIYSGVLESIADSAKVGGIEGNLPNFVKGSQKARIEGNNSQVAALLVGKVPGIRSDKDFERVIQPLLPAPTDTKDSLLSKKRALERFLLSQAPASYLERFGSPKKESKPEDRGFKAVP